MSMRFCWYAKNAYLANIQEFDIKNPQNDGFLNLISHYKTVKLTAYR